MKRFGLSERERERLFQMVFLSFIEKSVVVGAQENMWCWVNRKCVVVFILSKMGPPHTLSFFSLFKPFSINF